MAVAHELGYCVDLDTDLSYLINSQTTTNLSKIAQICKIAQKAHVLQKRKQVTSNSRDNIDDISSHTTVAGKLTQNSTRGVNQKYLTQ